MHERIFGVYKFSMQRFKYLNPKQLYMTHLNSRVFLIIYYNSHSNMSPPLFIITIIYLVYFAIVYCRMEGVKVGTVVVVIMW